MAFLDWVKKARQATSDSFGGISRGIGDVVSSKLNQDRIDASNARQRALDEQLLARAKAKGVKLPQIYGQGQQSLTRDVLGRDFTTREDITRSAKNFAGLATMGVSTPIKLAAKINNIASPGLRLAAWGGVRGLENAAPGVVMNTIQKKPIKQIAKEAGRDALTGALFNTALSPKLTTKAGKEILDETAGKVRLTFGNAAKLDAPVPSQKVQEVLKNGARVMVPQETIMKTIPNEQAAFFLKNGRYPGKKDVVPSYYGHKGNTNLIFDKDNPEKLLSWNTDNPQFAQDIKNKAITPGLTTRRISKSEIPIPKGETSATTTPKISLTSKKGEKFYTAEDPRSSSYRGKPFEETQGKRVEIVPELDTFIHRNRSGKWTVSEVTTGLTATPGDGYRTQQQAIKAAQENIAKHGMEKIKLVMGRSPKVPGADASNLQSKLPEDLAVAPQEIIGQKVTLPKPSTSAVDQVPAKLTTASGRNGILAKNQKGLQSQKLSAQSFNKNISTKQPEINVNRLNVSPEAKQRVIKATESIRPELEAIKGAKLTNQEVLEAAQKSDILRKAVSRDQTKKTAAAVTKLRQVVAAGAEGQGISKDFIENLQTLKSYSADAGRTLQAFSIGADPTMVTIKERVVKELLDLGKKTDDILEAAKGVDFDNPNQVNQFYRQFVKPTLGEIVDEYRYTNLLSSPQTHIVNAFSNMLQGTVLAPATKLYTGALDFVASGLTGKQRQAYVGEVPAYTKGFVNAMGEAIDNFASVIKGNKYIERPDIDRLPTGVKGLQVVPRILEAGDVFFRTLIKAGEKESLMYKAAKSGQAISKDLIDKQAAEKAAYYVFRSPVDPTNQSGQGAVLSGIDAMTNAVYGLRKVPGVKWFIPFVQTPMNILKQGIEYSPAGLTTMVGATNKTEQLAKAMIGSTVLAGAGMIAMKGDSTWAAPTGTKEKELFYASGRKPYSLKIGDKWYSYTRIGPLAYPMALAAAIKYEFEQNPKAQTEEVENKIARVVGQMAGFFSDQSYLQGIGDIVRTVGGDASAAKSALSNIPRQLVPLTSLQGWVARMIDPVYRKADTFSDSIKTGIPGLSKSVPAYTDPLGRPSLRAYPVGNSFSPIQVTPVSNEFESLYQNKQQERRDTAMVNKLKKDVEAGKKPSETGSIGKDMYQLEDGKVAVVLDGEIKKFDSREKAELAISKEAFKKSDKKFEVQGDIVFKKDKDGSVSEITLDSYNAKVLDQKIESASKANDTKTWVSLQEEKYNAIQSKLDSAGEDADPLDIATWKNDMTAIELAVQKKLKAESTKATNASKKAANKAYSASLTKLEDKLDRAKASKDYKGWEAAIQEQYNLVAEKLSGEDDPVTQANLQRKLTNIEQAIEKYRANGNRFNSLKVRTLGSGSGGSSSLNKRTISLVKPSAAPAAPKISISSNLGGSYARSGSRPRSLTTKRMG